MKKKVSMVQLNDISPFTMLSDGIQFFWCLYVELILRIFLFIQGDSMSSIFYTCKRVTYIYLGFTIQFARMCLDKSILKSSGADFVSFDEVVFEHHILFKGKTLG